MFARVYADSHYSYEPVQVVSVQSITTKHGTHYQYDLKRVTDSVSRDELRSINEERVVSLSDMIRRCNEMEAILLKDAARTDGDEWLADLSHWSGCKWEEGKRPL